MCHWNQTLGDRRGTNFEGSLVVVELWFRGGDGGRRRFRYHGSPPTYTRAGRSRIHFMNTCGRGGTNLPRFCCNLASTCLVIERLAVMTLQRLGTKEYQALRYPALDE